MLEGLEAVEIKLKDCLEIIDFRIDANTYKKDYILTDKLLKRSKVLSVEELSTSVQNFGAYSLCNFINFVNTPEVPFLITENIRHNYIDWSNLKYIDKESHEMLWKSHCKKGQVLVTMAGEYLGRVAVYDKDFVCSSNQAIAKVTLKKNLNPYFISTFLNSRHGQNQINRLKTITGQPNINMSLIKSLKIIILSNEFQARVEEVVKHSHQNLLESQSLYSDAQNILLEKSGLLGWSPTSKNNNQKAFSASFLKTGRLDAQYYQPKYDELENKIKAHSFKQIKDIRTDNYRGLQPIYFADGNLDVINSKHILEKSLDYEGFEKTSSEYWDLQERARVFKGDILIYTTGANIGRTQVYQIDKKAIASNHVNILRLKEGNPFYVGFVMNSIVGRLQTEKFSAGSAQAELYPKDVDEFLIPIIDEDSQNIIISLLEKSYLLQKESKNLLEVTRKAVEIAIEQNEVAALKFINESV